MNTPGNNIFRKQPEDYGDSYKMGSSLRQLVEIQLINDFKFYERPLTEYKFDWSESCGEGHGAFYLDGYVENYSAIGIYNKDNIQIAGGWMEFIFIDDFFLSYWEFLTIWENSKVKHLKSRVGIPHHVWIKVPEDLRFRIEKKRE